MACMDGIACVVQGILLEGDRDLGAYYHVRPFPSPIPCEVPETRFHGIEVLLDAFISSY